MQGSADHQDNQLRFPLETCNVFEGLHLPHISIDEARSVTKSCLNPLRENIITCKDTQIEAFLDEVKGLALDLTLKSSATDFSSYIPILDLGAGKQGGIPDDTPFVGLSIHDLVPNAIIFKAGSYHIQENIKFRSDILTSNGFKGKKVILFLSGADSLIENLWYNRNECNLFEIIRDMGFWGVSGFNFSVIGGECAFSQALNLKRSLFSAFELQRFGINAIPHVYAISQFQIDRWIAWFRHNPSVGYFVMNCQLQKKTRDIKQVIHSIKHILNALPNLHVILQGFPLPSAIHFGHIIERIHFADAQPIKNAHSHKYVLSYDDAFKCLYNHDGSKSVPDLIKNNVNYRESFIRDIRMKSIKKLISL